MSATEQARRKLDLGQVFGDTFAVLGRQWALLFAISIVLVFIPGLLAGALGLSTLDAGAGSPNAAAALVTNPLYVVAMIAGGLLGVVALCAQVHIAIGDLDGRRPELGETLVTALKKTLPILLLTFLQGVGVAFATLLVIFPGVILAIAWSVSLPAGMAETSNPVRALGRSRDLTRGNRWRIFGLFLIAWIMLLTGSVLVLALRGGASAVMGGGPGFGQLVLGSTINIFTSAFTAAGMAALYVQLRNLKSGGEALAQVFA